MLQSLQALDTPHLEESAEFQQEFGRKRLGANPTIESQIRRYQAMVLRGSSLPDEEVLGVLRLCGRRTDARLAFDSAGRRAAARAVRLTPFLPRLASKVLPSFLGRRLRWSLVRRVTRRVFEIELRQLEGHVVGTPIGPSRGPSATANGSACAFYASAIGELLRAFLSFEGAVLHDRCDARGNGPCRWDTKYV